MSLRIAVSHKHTTVIVQKWRITEHPEKLSKEKTYSKPKLEYNFLRSSLVSSVPMLKKLNDINHVTGTQNFPEKAASIDTFSSTFGSMLNEHQQYLFMVMLTALLSASKARRSDIISAVAPPSFYKKNNSSCKSIKWRLVTFKWKENY